MLQVITPNIFLTDLWKISGTFNPMNDSNPLLDLTPPAHTPGHYACYHDDMFIFKTKEGQEFGMKPMNCPAHCLMVSRVHG